LSVNSALSNPKNCSEQNSFLGKVTSGAGVKQKGSMAITIQEHLLMAGFTHQSET
jgi:hypothetical protein